MSVIYTSSPIIKYLPFYSYPIENIELNKASYQSTIIYTHFVDNIFSKKIRL